MRCHRLIVQTFVMDVKNALLFGGEPLMSFKDMMDLRIPGDTDAAWFAQNLSEWEAATSKLSAELTNSTPQSFVALLKDLWQSVTPSVNSDGRASGSITQMYGILSIARELARREDNVLLQKPGQMSTLATTVERSLTMWERAWRKSAIGSEIPWMLPTCTCLLQLARNTLFEISPVELQIVAGRDVIEGKRRGRADYESALRKIKSWAKHQRGRQGVARKSFTLTLSIRLLTRVPLQELHRSSNLDYRERTLRSTASIVCGRCISPFSSVGTMSLLQQSPFHLRLLYVIADCNQDKQLWISRKHTSEQPRRSRSKPHQIRQPYRPCPRRPAC